MRLNADFDRAVMVACADNRWQPSPLPGVDRMMLDRIGDEVARATSIVRYAPASRFSAHVHEGGEEFLVLDGVFSDDSGDFGPGTYVRNPIGTSHAPWSAGGTTIFVKLHQFAADDGARVVIDTVAALAAAEEDSPGVRSIDLHRFGREHVRMIDLGEGGSLAIGHDPGGAEILVTEGAARCGDDSLRRWDWLRLPDATRRAVSGDGRCRLLVKTGHLAGPALTQWTDAA